MSGLAVPATDHRAYASRWRGPGLILLAMVPIAVLLLVGAQGLLLWVHPASQGSISAVYGTPDDTCVAGDPPSATCVVYDYAPGKRAGLAFSVRNDGPIAMTVERVEPIGAELVPLVALYPALPMDQHLLSFDETRPFQPVEVQPGDEAEILLVGEMSGDCADVAPNWSPDSGLIIDHANLTVRWGLIPSSVTLPLGSALEVRIPHSGACPGAG